MYRFAQAMTKRASWDVSTPGRKPFSDEELAGSPTKRALQGLE
jgi:hypothetical protein